MNFNSTALNTFRSAADWEADTMTRIDDGDVAKNGEYGGMFSALKRTDAERESNNCVRTALLKALAQAFDLGGVREKDEKTAFPADFMAKLEKLLGGALKRGDFEVGADGTVKSGKPLTARRIKAIIETAEEVGIKAQAEAAKAASANGPIKTEFGTRKEVYNPYFEKFATITSETKNAPKHVKKFFNRIGITLNFIANELDMKPVGENETDRSALRNDQAYEYNVLELKQRYTPDMNKFQYFDDKKQEFVPLRSRDDYQNKFLFPKIGGGLLHLERAKFDVKESPTIAPLRKYVADNLRMLVTKSIDLYFACKEAGKLGAYFEHLESPGACIEDQCLHLVDFETEHLSQNWKKVSDAEAADLERIANGKVGVPPNADDEFNLIFSKIDRTPLVQEKDEWDDEIAAVFKKELVGKTVTMTKMGPNHKFVPIIENGKPVIKKLTDADVDKFGKMMFDALYN